ncbi:SprT protein [Marinospirillum celere]|uniref:Protein SprT n=1 Tax=Marinospirillum celere TaxID=1122252 RepID=A0A1I1GWF9_9GAMM|nr:SprT family zinc-dependent metalloprotease [Marinospirillum celere]SFC16014.1 SprT protein [Marinospirillum celere]
MNEQQSLFESLARPRHNPGFVQLRSQVLHCYALAENFYLKSFPRPEVRLDLRGRSAGVAELNRNRLRFNPVLLKENQEAFLSEVVPHEVAHLLAWQLHGRKIKPHGREWQQIMQQVFELKPKATHQFDTRRSARQGYIYQCACPGKEHALTVRRHNKILRGQRYICRECNSFLGFVRLDQSVTEG